MAQMSLLAPDWTESNWRTVTGMIPGLNNKIGKWIGDNPEVADMKGVYRSFWMGAAFKGVLSTALLQGAILGLFGDEDDREEYYNFMTENLFSLDKFPKARWASVDLTPLARKLGLGDPEKRQVFSVLGHFKDILKISNPVNLAKHKISPLARIGETAFTGKDWKGTRFSTVGEMRDAVLDGTWLPPLTANNKYAKDMNGIAWWSTLPALIGYNVRQSIPIFASNTMEAIQGESSWFGSLARASGFDLRDVSSRSKGQRKFEEVRKDINSLDKQLKEARASKDRTLITKAKQEIKNYPNFNKAKSRMNYARTQLSVVNRKIKGLEKVEVLSPRQERELRKLKEKKEQIFEKFYTVINR
jgi:hypothetical protein